MNWTKVVAELKRIGAIKAAIANDHYRQIAERTSAAAMAGTLLSLAEAFEAGLSDGH